MGKRERPVDARGARADLPFLSWVGPFFTDCLPRAGSRIPPDLDLHCAEAPFLPEAAAGDKWPPLFSSQEAGRPNSSTQSTHVLIGQKESRRRLNGRNAAESRPRAPEQRRANCSLSWGRCSPAFFLFVLLGCSFAHSLAGLRHIL